MHVVIALVFLASAWFGRALGYPQDLEPLP